jgi:hypothetical protein
MSKSQLKKARRTETKLPPIPKGEARKFYQCLKCKRAAYLDYVPFSCSNPILMLECCNVIIEHKNGSQNKYWRIITPSYARKLRPFKKESIFRSK